MLLYPHRIIAGESTLQVSIMRQTVTWYIYVKCMWITPSVSEVGKTYEIIWALYNVSLCKRAASFESQMEGFRYPNSAPPPNVGQLWQHQKENCRHVPVRDPQQAVTPAPRWGVGKNLSIFVLHINEGGNTPHPGSRVPAESPGALAFACHEQSHRDIWAGSPSGLHKWKLEMFS